MAKTTPAKTTPAAARATPAAARATPAPARTREDLLIEHAAARHRRDAAPLGSPEFRKATEDVADIEVEIARIERAMTPPRG
jgi:hypothetical protein